MKTDLESLKADLGQKFDLSKFRMSEKFQDTVMEVPKEQIQDLLRHFKDTRRFDFLMDVCGADYTDRE
ncbi:MAG: NADH-quinone oxidoreductase subunit C, partial [Bdellovibrionales bacterium]|nr:NADH-quinone oxidoreductase subunit C [Bdellovibrionales bacterium]